jgi:hypothetical protein
VVAGEAAVGINRWRQIIVHITGWYGDFKHLPSYRMASLPIGWFFEGKSACFLIAFHRVAALHNTGAKDDRISEHIGQRNCRGSRLLETVAHYRGS